MLIYVSQTVFANDSNNEGLDDLIRIVQKGRHSLFLKSEEDLEAIYNSEWLKTVGERMGFYVEELIQHVYRKNAYSMAKRNIKVNISEKCEHDIDYTLKDAIIYLNEPCVIVLENSKYDKYFIESIIRSFDREAVKIRFYLEKRWLKFGNAGGRTNIENYIGEEYSNFKNESKEPKFYKRFLVIIDSDKKYPAMADNCDELRKFCTKNNDLIHVLYKREMENYLPELNDNAIIELIREKYNGYLKLNDDQMDFYDLELGFQKRKEDLKGEIQQLYNDTDKENYILLTKGMHSSEYNFKQEFPKLFEHDSVNKIALKKRCAGQQNKNELEEILNKINELIA